ncbi:ATP-grasp domain-containing protein [Myroides odoratimimus]|uniref:ATP-grasp domain-containing protein n=1 Tax=Myroides odoratimimus TaxID=76832 RepID=UPI0025751A69|nr:ATP-grasp domain-containing protein [Myroides odoratimimus]MDM1466508.1 ATP-grasp domain-containing protein [Myroides odoratimimus]MDM1469658.1 ATP-grasp domain-containing protein [Myroides odoratimimus]MDM1479670.1 ATP-grasp domain-containing protein [Myroides odoratimimus]
MKKILLLGGAYAQIPFIKGAKDKGLYVITCDYLPSNPGHKYADEYYNVSTTDRDSVLELAIELKPDYIYAYASDPSIPVATYVSEKLGIGINPFTCVEVFSDKDFFRKFLVANNFNAPRNVVITKDSNYSQNIKELKFPIIVKPTDSSGSKGVVKVNDLSLLEDAITYAFSFSRNQKLIAEEFIESNGHQFHGDGFVVNGKLVFHSIGDHHYNEKINPFVPFSTSWPTIKSKDELDLVVKEVSNIIEKSGYINGPINIEARIDVEGKVYIMEIGLRSGGNFVPQIIHHSTGFDMVDATLSGLMKKEILVPKESVSKYSAYYVIHSGVEGTLQQIVIDDEISSSIIQFHQYIQKGELVKSFQGSNAAVGLLLISFESLEDQIAFYKKSDKLVQVILE